MSDSLAVCRSIDIEAVQLDRTRGDDTGRRRFALHLGEGYQYLALVREQCGHVRIEQFTGLLSNAESAAQMLLHVGGSIVRAEGLLERACGKGGQCRGIAAAALANLNGFTVQH